MFNEKIDVDSYRINAGSFEPVDRESDFYKELDILLNHRRNEQTASRFCIDDSDEEWSQRVVYTVGLDLSDRTNQTVPIFEFNLPGISGFEKLAKQRSRRQRGHVDRLSVYTDHLRELFIDQDNGGTVQGFGPIGKCLKVSQSQNVILLLNGFDRVPPKAQPMFFDLLERNRVNYAVEREGNPENLYVFSTVDTTSDREELELKTRRLLGGFIRRE